MRPVFQEKRWNRPLPSPRKGVAGLGWGCGGLRGLGRGWDGGEADGSGVVISIVGGGGMGLDVLEHGFDGLIEREIGGVDVDGILGPRKGADGPNRVAHVPLEELAEDFFEFHVGIALALELGDARFGHVPRGGH